MYTPPARWTSFHMNVLSQVACVVYSGHNLIHVFNVQYVKHFFKQIYCKCHVWKVYKELCCGRWVQMWTTWDKTVYSCLSYWENMLKMYCVAYGSGLQDVSAARQISDKQMFAHFPFSPWWQHLHQTIASRHEGTYLPGGCSLFAFGRLGWN